MAPINPRLGGWSFDPYPDLPRERVLVDAELFTPADRSRLLTLARRYDAGQVREDTPETLRWLFYRWAYRKGLYED